MSRTRVFVDDSSTSEYRKYWAEDGYPDGYAYDEIELITTSFVIDTMIDHVTPNYKQRSACGEVILNPMTRYQHELHLEPLVLERSVTHKLGNTAETVGNYLKTAPGLMAPSPGSRVDEIKTLLADEISQSVNEAFSRVELSEAQILASLGELPETLRWLASLYRRFIRIYSLAKLKRLKLKRPSKEQVEEIWMELRYAVRPLIYDAVQCMNALQAHIDKSERHKATSVVLFDKQYGTTSQEKVIGNEEHGFFANWTSSGLETARIKSGVLFQIEESLNTFNAVWGIDQPFESVWELVPFSFIIDWFWSIGDTIAAWSINPHLKVLGSWYVVTHSNNFNEWVSSLDVRGNSVPNMDWTLNSHSFTPATRSMKENLKFRVINPNRSVIPVSRIKLDFKKLIDLAIIGKKLSM